MAALKLSLFADAFLDFAWFRDDRLRVEYDLVDFLSRGSFAL